jgi:hypothetical protein
MPCLRYTWGRGKAGVLGHGDEQRRDVPKLVQIDDIGIAPSPSSPERVVAVSCGLV